MSSTRERILKDKQSISTYTVNKIVEKWDRDETIMNLAARIKELDFENGVLKSEIESLKDKIPKKGILQLRQETKRLTNRNNLLESKNKRQAEVIKRLEYSFKIDKISKKL